MYRGYLERSSERLGSTNHPRQDYTRSEIERFKDIQPNSGLVIALV